MAASKIRVNAGRIIVGIAGVLAVVLAGGFVWVQFINS